MSKVVHPSFGAASFSCPHCGALADQRWLQAYGLNMDKRPTKLDPEVSRSYIEQYDEVNDNSDLHKQTLLWAKSIMRGMPFIHRDREYCADLTIEMFHYSICHSCKEISIWRKYELLHPIREFDVDPNPDMPSDVAEDFREAAAILGVSPRGAAALLRLALQRMMPHLDLPGENINKDIGALVKRGLPASVQQALDVVRVVGNSAVHPGQIDLRDNRETALRLFGLLNIITEQMISQPLQIAEMFGELPKTAHEQIARRDGQKAIAPPENDPPSPRPPETAS